MHFPGLSHSGSGSQVLHKGTDSVGPAFCALPGSEQLRWPGTWPAHSPQVGRCFLSPPQSQPLGFPGAPWECCLRCAMCLLWGADFWLWPSWQMSTVQDPRKTWLATGSLLAVGRRCHFWGRVCPLPSGSGCRLPTSLLPVGDRLVHCWLALLWYSLSPLFCEWAWQCLRLELFMGKFSLSLSLAIPEFGLPTHIGSLRLPSGHSGPVLTLSNAARASLFSPCLLVVDASIWATSLLGVAVRCKICGFYLFIFSSRLCYPLRFQNSPQTRWWEGFLVFGNFSSFMTPSPGQVSVPNSFVSLFIFYIFSYLLLNTMCCLSGCLVSSASVQKLFCGVCSAFKWSFDEFVGEKVVSLSYSSTILGPSLISPFKSDNYSVWIGYNYSHLLIWDVLWLCRGKRWYYFGLRMEEGEKYMWEEGGKILMDEKEKNSVSAEGHSDNYHTLNKRVSVMGLCWFLDSQVATVLIGWVN